jgi:hypothetical protein
MIVELKQNSIYKQIRAKSYELTSGIGSIGLVFITSVLFGRIFETSKKILQQEGVRSV